MIIALTIVLTVISAFLYRIGGSSKESAAKFFPWYPQWAVRSKVREVGCTALTFIWLAAAGFTAPWWALILAIVGTYLFMTTYWDDIFKGEDNYAAHGFGIGIALLPVVLFSGGLIGSLVRIVVMAVGMWAVSLGAYKYGDLVHEFGRGALIIATLPLLLL